MKTVQTDKGALHPKFSAKLREANLFGAFTEVTTARFHRYLLQPKHILRNGWLLDPELELDQRSVRTYILGDSAHSHENPDAVGQCLKIDRKNREATLTTHCASQKQTIRFDMTSMEVIANWMN